MLQNSVAERKVFSGLTSPGPTDHFDGLLAVRGSAFARQILLFIRRRETASGEGGGLPDSGPMIDGKADQAPVMPLSALATTLSNEDACADRTSQNQCSRCYKRRFRCNQGPEGTYKRARHEDARSVDGSHVPRTVRRMGASATSGGGR